MVLEGVDYSRGGFPSPEGLKKEGKTFVVRYVVDDLSPTGRGLTKGEYETLRTNGIDVAVVWEGTESRIMDGEAAGASDAQNAQKNINRIGLPQSIPVYFACDFDAQPSDQLAIDNYLRGCANVLGFNRVGIYGGFHVIDRCIQNRSASLFWQTSAWSDGAVHILANLYQYKYNHYITGVNCDDDKALQSRYGQASLYEPKFYPNGIDLDLAKLWFGKLTYKKKEYSFDPSGPISKLWMQHGKETGRYPAIAAMETYDTREYVRFSDGLTLWRPNNKEDYRVLKG